MAIVYIPHQPDNAQDPFNLEAAKRFGEIQILLQGRQSVFKVDLMKELLEEGLKPYKADDYILASGHKLLFALSIAHLIKRFGKVNLLIYSEKFKQFSSVTLGE